MDEVQTDFPEIIKRYVGDMFLDVQDIMNLIAQLHNGYNVQVSICWIKSLVNKNLDGHRHIEGYVLADKLGAKARRVMMTRNMRLKSSLRNRVFALSK